MRAETYRESCLFVEFFLRRCLCALNFYPGFDTYDDRHPTADDAGYCLDNEAT
jgi:hypothetical protein